MKSQYLVLGLFFFAIGCVQHKSEHHTKELLAPKNIEKSFQVSENSELRVQKNSLGKAFLLRATYKHQTNAPAWHDLKPLVVVFEKNGDELAMFERDALAAYTVVDTSRLVTSFKITKETDDDITFSWGRGLKIIPRTFYDDGAEEEDSSVQQQASGVGASMETVESFVKSSDIKDNKLHIRQAVRVRMSTMKDVPKSSGSKEKIQRFETLETSLEVDYVLKPYEINPRFQPKVVDPLNRIGFFKTAVGIETFSAKQKLYATHWDLSDEAGPITFAISKHFPESTMAAVKEGILYWNIVMGKEKIKVIENFEPGSDFPDRTVVVNWLPWEDAGSAWANFQADPLTGEILRGQIYMTSVFLQLPKEFPEDKPHEILSLSGMRSGQVCHYSKQSLELPPELSESKKEKYIMDQLRHVVAHEVGHTMGLRHNFAGSMDSALRAQELNVEKKKYETEMNHEGAALSSSIMDYIRGIEEGMIGRWIQKKPLAYDVEALKWVNSPESEVKTNLVFCTDDNVSKAYKEKLTLYGCTTFDAPANPFNVRAEETQRILNNLVKAKFDSILSALYPAGSNEVRELSVVLQSDYQKTYAGLSNGRLDLSVLNPIFSNSGGEDMINFAHFRNQVGNMWDSNSASLEDLLKTHLSEVGGVTGIIKGILPLNSAGDYDPKFLSNQLNALKASQIFSKGTTAEGRSYTLSEEQQAKIEKYLLKGIGDYELIPVSMITQLKPYADKEVITNGKTEKQSKSIRYGIGQTEWFPELQAFFAKLVLAQKEIKTEKLNEKDIAYGVPTFGEYYRKELAAMMSPSLWKFYGISDLLSKTKIQLTDRFKALYSQIELGTELIPPTTDSAGEHEAFIEKLKSQNKIPSALTALVQQDLNTLKVLETAN